MKPAEKTRASIRTLDVPNDAVDSPVFNQAFLTFRLGAEIYGIDILKVQEIHRYEKPTRIVNDSTFTKGVINLRGVIVPIIDMRERLSLSEAAIDDCTTVVVLNLTRRIIGIVVDSVDDVIDLNSERILPVPAFKGGENATFIVGLGTVMQGDSQRMLILLDMEALLANSEIGLTETPSY